MRACLAIVRNTLLETVRQPVYGLILACSCLLIALIPATAAHLYTFTSGTGLEHVPERMVADLGLATVQLAGLILAVFVTAGVVSREIEEMTVATVLSKPVGRVTFLLGKFFGVALGISFATGAASAVTLLTIRVGSPLESAEPIDWGVVAGLTLAFLGSLGWATARNYFRGRSWVGSFNLSFVLCVAVIFVIFAVVDRDYDFIFAPGYVPHGRELAGKDAGLVLTYDWQVFQAAILTSESVLVMVAVALAASTRLGTIGNGIATGGVFVLGLTARFLQAQLAEAMPLAASLFRVVIPQLERFWLSDALVREVDVPGSYVLITSLYALSYISGALCFAALLFDRRDVA